MLNRQKLLKNQVRSCIALERVPADEEYHLVKRKYVEPFVGGWRTASIIFPIFRLSLCPKHKCIPHHRYPYQDYELLSQKGFLQSYEFIEIFTYYSQYFQEDDQ